LSEETLPQGGINDEKKHVKILKGKAQHANRRRKLCTKGLGY